MPLDPRIALGVQPPAFNNPFEQLAQIRQQQQQEARQEQQLKLDQQRLTQNQSVIDEAKQAKLSAQQIRDAAESAYQQIKGGDVEAILGNMAPEVRQVTEGWLKEFSDSKLARDTQRDALRKKTAKLIQAHDYNPVSAATAIRLLGDDDPEVKGALEQVENPAALKKIVDYYATLGDPAPQPYTLGEGGQRRGPNNELLAENPPEPKPVVQPSLQQQIAEAARTKNGSEMRRLLNVQGQINAAGRAPEKGESLTPNAALDATLKLRDRFVRETAAASTVAQQFALMQSSLDAVKKGAAAPGSQGVLVTFQKILDPTSVVRESEYARSASGLSLLNRIEGSYDKIKQGGAGVPVAELEQFVNLSQQFVKNQAQAANRTKEQIDNIAKDYGLKSDNITRTFGSDEPAKPSGPAVGSTVTYNGKRYRVTGITNGQADLEPLP